MQDSRRLEAKQSHTLIPAFIAVLAMMAGLIVYGIYHLSTINNHVQKISQEHIVIWDMVTDMRFAARERILSLTRIIATDDPFVREEEWMKFNDQASVFIENRQRLLAQNLNGREFALLARQGELTRKATAIQDEIIALAMDEQSTKAHSLLTEEGIPAQDAVLNVLHELYAMQEREIEKARHQANGAYHHARLLMGTIGLFAVLLGCIIAFVVTRQNRQHRDQLVKEKTLAQITLHSIADGVITTDHSGHIVHLNTKAEELLGVSAASAYGMTSKQLLRLAYEDHSKVDVDPITATIMSRSKQHSISPMLLNNQDGTQHVIEYTVAPIIEKGHLHGAILVFHDVTELHVLTEQLQYHASHDALTGLINRREFEHRLQISIETAKVEKLKHVLCYLDLDQFKVVNDTCGHLAGDQLLKQLSNHLSEQLRSADILARLGGDEFAVLLESCPLEKAEEIAEKLRLAIKENRFIWDGKPFEIGVSIGIVPIDSSSGTLNDVLRSADTACYIAKDLGRNRIHIFYEEDQHVSKHSGEMQWSHRIQSALEKDMFCLHAERIKQLQGDEELGVHYEILLRLEEQEDTLIPPMAFIPAAERFNLMPELDRWVIRNACHLLSNNIEAIERENMVFTINLSGQSINDSEFISFLEKVLENAKIGAERICFEITETTAITSLEAARDLINTAKSFGCSFALDDFGTGFSSFSYLKNLPVDYIKIDGSFIRDILEDPMDRLMVESMHRTGKLLGIHTIAEYVETETICNVLQEIGIDYAQGWHISKPVLLTEIFA